MRAVARCPGTCGELVQGTQKGRHVHITCPVNLYAEAKVALFPGQGVSCPTGHPKAAAAVGRTLAYLGLTGYGAVLEVSSLIPRGKGMAGSTADTAAAIAATAAAAGRTMGYEQIGQIALAIEPSDGVFFPGLVAFDHVTGSYRQYLGEPPDLQVLCLDPGGTVDTGQFNARPDLPAANRAKEALVEEAFDLVAKGLARRDGRLIGQGASLSALAHQAILPKARLDQLLALVCRLGAYGLNVAHSGTVIGVLYGKEADQRELADQVGRFVPQWSQRWLKLISGGVKVID